MLFLVLIMLRFMTVRLIVGLTHRSLLRKIVVRLFAWGHTSGVKRFRLRRLISVVFVKRVLILLFWRLTLIVVFMILTILTRQIVVPLFSLLVRGSALWRPLMSRGRVTTRQSGRAKVRSGPRLTSLRHQWGRRFRRRSGPLFLLIT